MDSLFGGSGIRTLRKMVKKGLIKPEDLDTPPSGWFLSMGYERENKTGKWICTIPELAEWVPGLAVLVPVLAA